MKRIYSFEYKDHDYHDTYQSDEHNSRRDALEEWKEIKKWHENGCHITETWIHDEKGNFLGRWKI